MKALSERYDWTEEELLQEWEAAKTNPRAIWSKDDYGVWTVSLLRVATASAARELNHSKGVDGGHRASTDDMEATFSSFSVIQLIRNECSNCWVIQGNENTYTIINHQA